MDVGAQGSWLFLFQMLQGIGQIGSVAVAFYAVRLVQGYTHKKDEADFLRNRWNEQAQVNLLCMQNDAALTSHEEVVYGRPVSDLSVSRRYFVIFSIVNQTLHLFVAFKHGVLTKQEFENYALGSLRLLKREQATVTYLLNQRGYTQQFRDAILPLLDKVTASEPPGPT